MTDAMVMGVAAAGLFIGLGGFFGLASLGDSIETAVHEYCNTLKQLKK